MEHNVITHPGGERVRKGLPRCLPNRLRVSLFSSPLSLLLLLFVLLFLLLLLLFFELVSYRKFNNFDILLHFYCVCDIIKRFYDSSLSLFVASTLGRVLCKHLRMPRTKVRGVTATCELA